jgi:hypothetical protein
LNITDADREAANALRVVLADICGFWHKPGDDSPLCVALARHRIEAERQTAELLRPILAPAATAAPAIRVQARVPTPPSAKRRATADLVPNRAL